MLSVDCDNRSQAPKWLHDHPHVAHLDRMQAPTDNTIYVARDRLSLKGAKDLPGGGRFRAWSDKLKLSANDDRRSHWSVPLWMDPSSGRKPLSHHSDLRRWRREGDQLLLQTVAKGQVFVLDCAEYPEAIPWARKIIERHSMPSA